MLKATLMLLSVPLFLMGHLALSTPQHIRAEQVSAGISQLVENRDGHKSCRGLVIQLGKLRFRKTIRPEQIIISEAKHSRDLKDIMTWRVEQGGKRLIVKFKSGMGGFGSGNVVGVFVDRTAFVNPDEATPNQLRWTITTDIL